MAATLETNRTTDGTAGGQSHTGPCTVHLRGGSTLTGAAEVDIQIAKANTAAHFASVGETFAANRRVPITINSQGTYFVRAVLSTNNGTASVTVETTGG